MRIRTCMQWRSQNAEKRYAHQRKTTGSSNDSQLHPFLKWELLLTLSLPNATVVELIVHCLTRLQSKFTGTVDSGLFLTVIWGATLCSLSQNVNGT